MPRALNHPDYSYSPWSEHRRERAAALAKRRLGAPAGYCTIYGVHVPDTHAAGLRVAAQKVAAKQGYVEASKFVTAAKAKGWRIADNRPWSDQEDAALRRYHFKRMTASQIGKALGRSRNSIIGRRFRLHLSSPPRGCGFLPPSEVFKLAAGHLDVAVGEQDATTATILIASMFIGGGGTAKNIATYLSLPLHVVEAVARKMIAAKLWNARGLVDMERYTRGGKEGEFKECDMLLVMDTLLATGRAKLKYGKSGEELWYQ